MLKIQTDKNGIEQVVVASRITRSPHPPTEDEHYAAFEQPEYLAALARVVDARPHQGCWAVL